MAQSVELTSGQTEFVAEPAARRRVRAWALDWRMVVVLVALCLLGAGLRVRGLGRLGFAEDEINKLEAVRAYAQGDITQNAEHPMLMKVLIFVSLRAADAWNAQVALANEISEETALRLANALVGALTVFPLFLLTAAMFDRKTGLVAAALWACGINAIAINRIGKEDTLLVFFMLLAFYLFLRAKLTSGFELRRKNKFYVWSAVSFGLMLASKYFPHYFGLNMLYHHLVQVRERAPDEPRGRTPRFFYLLIPIAFCLASPAILLAAHVAIHVRLFRRTTRAASRLSRRRDAL